MMKLIPPLNFARIDAHTFRSSYPPNKTLPYIKTLKLKSMICLTPGDIRGDLREFCGVNGIELLEFDIGFNQEPFVTMSVAEVTMAIKRAINPQNQPCLIFCSNGKMRTSCVTACIRKAQGWSLVSIFHEYESFTIGEGGVIDLQFIETFNVDNLACDESSDS